MEKDKKLHIAKLSGNKCSRCGCVMEPNQFELHHIKPLSDGGTNDIKNMVLLCPNCHKEIHTSENNRLAGAGIGGAVLGASLGGPMGAIVGGIVGLIMGDSVNKTKGGNLMDKAIFIPSAILGLIFVGVYAFNCHKYRQKFNHQVMVNAILQASGIVCGSLLILSTFFSDFKQYLSNIDLYILISGLAVLVVSIQSAYNDLRVNTVENDSTNEPIQPTTKTSAD